MELEQQSNRNLVPDSTVQDINSFIRKFKIENCFGSNKFQILFIAQTKKAASDSRRNQTLNSRLKASHAEDAIQKRAGYHLFIPPVSQAQPIMDPCVFKFDFWFL